MRFYDREGQIIFVSDEILAKRPQKPNYENQRKLEKFEKKWEKPKMKSLKSS